MCGPTANRDAQEGQVQPTWPFCERNGPSEPDKCENPLYPSQKDNRYYSPFFSSRGLGAGVGEGRACNTEKNGSRNLAERPLQHPEEAVGDSAFFSSPQSALRLNRALRSCPCFGARARRCRSQARPFAASASDLEEFAALSPRPLLFWKKGAPGFCSVLGAGGPWRGWRWE